MSSDAWQALAIAVLLIVATWSAIARAALDAITLPRAARLVDEERPGAARIVRLLEDARHSWAALTLLLVASSLTAVALTTELLLGYLVPWAAVTVAAVTMTILIHVFGELIPRSQALRSAEGVALRLAGGALIVSSLLRVPALTLAWLGGRLLPGDDGVEAFITEEEIRDLIDEGQALEPAERKMIHSIFELSDTLVREIMVPRPDVVMVSQNEPLDRVVEVILEHGYSRIPVHEGEDRDDVAGVLYAKDVLRRIHATGSEDVAWADLIRAPYVVPELKSVDGLLTELQAEQVHLAIVVDEYGALAGIATIEDVLEEIVGEIVDEYDSEEALVELIGDDHWRVDARLPVDDLSELCGTDLPAEEWDTVGGLLFGTLGHVPRPGESVRVDGLRLVAERVRGRRIAEVVVQRVSPGSDPPGDEDRVAVRGEVE